MFPQQISHADVDYHLERIRSDFSSSQRVISISGLREIVGTTFIQLGSSIRGRATEACREAEERRESNQPLRGAEFQTR